MSKREKRYDQFGPIVLMAKADNWYFVRRPNAKPFALYVTEWFNLKSEPVTKPGDQKP